MVEYGVHELFKGKSPAAAARATAKKLSGYENLFLGPGTVFIDSEKLEAELWRRMRDHVIKGIERVRSGKEDYALDGTVLHFRQKPSAAATLRALVIEELGRDPFPPAQIPNGGYYVWVLDERGEPLLEGPYGPHELEQAKALARIGATEGEHSRAVSRGRTPTEKSFEVVREYEAGTGERLV